MSFFGKIKRSYNLFKEMAITRGRNAPSEDNDPAKPPIPSLHPENSPMPPEAESVVSKVVRPLARTLVTDRIPTEYKPIEINGIQFPHPSVDILTLGKDVLNILLQRIEHECIPNLNPRNIFEPGETITFLDQQIISLTQKTGVSPTQRRTSVSPTQIKTGVSPKQIAIDKLANLQQAKNTDDHTAAIETYATLLYLIDNFSIESGHNFRQASFSTADIREQRRSETAKTSAILERPLSPPPVVPAANPDAAELDDEHLPIPPVLRQRRAGIRRWITRAVAALGLLAGMKYGGNYVIQKYEEYQTQQRIEQADQPSNSGIQDYDSYKFPSPSPSPAQSSEEKPQEEVKKLGIDQYPTLDELVTDPSQIQ